MILLRVKKHSQKKARLASQEHFLSKHAFSFKEERIVTIKLSSLDEV